MSNLKLLPEKRTLEDEISNDLPDRGSPLDLQRLTSHNLKLVTFSKCFEKLKKGISFFILTTTSISPT